MEISLKKWNENWIWLRFGFGVYNDHLPRFLSRPMQCVAKSVTRFFTRVLSYTSTCCLTNWTSPSDCILPCRCYARIHNLTKPKQRSPFIDLFSFAKLASIVHTISFAGFTGTNGSICFHQVSYLKQFLLSSLSRLLGKFSVKKKPVPRNKFTIKPSFYVRSNS